MPKTRSQVLVFVNKVLGACLCILVLGVHAPADTCMLCQCVHVCIHAYNVVSMCLVSVMVPECVCLVRVCVVSGCGVNVSMHACVSLWCQCVCVCVYRYVSVNACLCVCVLSP